MNKAMQIYNDNNKNWKVVCGKCIYGNGTCPKDGTTCCGSSGFHKFREYIEGGNKMDNLWVNIANRRGLKLGEEFKYSGNHYCVLNRITENGLEHRKESSCSEEWYIEDGDTISEFIAGIGEITKLSPKFAEPLKCEGGDNYLCILPNGIKAVRIFRNNATDYYRRKAGNMFDVNAFIPQEQVDKILKEMKEY